MKMFMKKLRKNKETKQPRRTFLKLRRTLLKLRKLQNLYIHICVCVQIYIYIYMYRWFSHDVTAAIFVSQNNEMAGIFVSQINPMGL